MVVGIFACNLGSLSAFQRHAVPMVFRWQADKGRFNLFTRYAKYWRISTSDGSKIGRFEFTARERGNR